MAKKKKSDRPGRVNICFEQLIFDLDFMSNEYAGIILKMIVWYSAGTSEGKQRIEQMRQYIDSLPLTDKAWLTSTYKRLFKAIDDDFNTYADKCEKNRQIALEREERRRKREQETTNVHEREQETTNVHERARTYTNNNNNYNNNHKLSKDNNNNIILEEEEDTCVREEKSEAMSLENFCKIWNGAIAKAKKNRDDVRIKPITKDDLPGDAQERIAKALKDIEGWMDEQTVQKVGKANGFNPAKIPKADLAKWYMVASINKYATVSMKSRDTSFGSFNWFVNDPKRIRKLFDGDIQ